MAAPLIGITTSRGLSRYSLPTLSLTEAYVESVTRAGGCPVLIPLGIADDLLLDLLARLDGILFSGGGDIHPARYGSQPHPLVNSVDEDRDRVEITLFQETLERETPFFGICRGIQVANIALGGSLYEDLLDQRPDSLEHDRFPEQPRDYLAHPVKVEEDSRLGHILGAPLLEVNSMHHQGIRRLAAGLRATAYASDGVIEGVELADYPFGVAVQWHPEWLQDQLAMRSLFQEFIQAAQKRR